MNLYTPKQNQYPLNKTIFKTQQSNSFQITKKLSLAQFNSPTNNHQLLRKQNHNMSVTNQRANEHQFFQENKSPHISNNKLGKTIKQSIVLKPIKDLNQNRVKTETYRNYLSQNNTDQDVKKEENFKNNLKYDQFTVKKFNFQFENNKNNNNTSNKKLNQVNSAQQIQTRNILSNKLSNIQIKDQQSEKTIERNNLLREKRIQSQIEQLRMKQQKPQNNIYRSILQLPNFRPSIKSRCEIGMIKGFGANSNQGAFRNYNEDRMSLVSKNKEGLGFFGVFDGHGGYAAAEYLKEHLVHLLFHDPKFKSNIEQGIVSACSRAEQELFQKYRSGEENGEGNLNLYRSGSCASFVLIQQKMCYVGNVGDCRIIASYDRGGRVEQITRDHKPNDPIEKQRVETHGGTIYQTRIVAQVIKNMVQNELGLETDYDHQNNVHYLLGPHRVMPQKLSVARTFGDFHLKARAPKVVSSEPDVQSFVIQPQLDFLIIASDGIFDKLTNEEIIGGVWTNSQKHPQTNFNEMCARQAEFTLLQSINRKTVDNVTVIFIAFQNYYNAVVLKDTPQDNFISPIKTQN